ncbi:T-cell-specific surface glycoprotein CD28 [Platichthys flesus]|uniref:T-cell-specific surface glycoprotein CD28 n=1 Tax=Platichthys flesus TaxID=8260 RepID=UPI002DBAE0F1|nr:T-cell-specific surface glycoprotein CD28 [Platichthys flesus]
MRGKSLVGHYSSVGGKFTLTLREMRRSIGWTFLLLLGCRLSCATHVSPSTCPCDVQLKTVCAPGREDVFVPCPNVTADEIRFKLFKEQELISNVTCTRENNTLTCTLLHTTVGVKVENQRQGSVDFVLTGVTESSYGSYRCEGLVMFPPPLKTVPSAVLKLVKGHACRSKKDTTVVSSDSGDNPSQPLFWIWIVLVAFLSIYSGTVTVIAIVIWVRMRKEASQSDYMNTKPGGMRDGRRKRGIQKPIPRHF